ncbi:MAG: hypothetical protein AAFX39_03310 [Pseudomonadota bacterium]
MFSSVVVAMPWPKFAKRDQNVLLANLNLLTELLAHQRCPSDISAHPAAQRIHVDAHLGEGAAQSCKVHIDPARHAAERLVDAIFLNGDVESPDLLKLKLLFDQFLERHLPRPVATNAPGHLDEARPLLDVKGRDWLIIDERGDTGLRVCLGRSG